MKIQKRLQLAKLKLLEFQADLLKRNLVRNVKDLGLDWVEYNIRLQQIEVFRFEILLLQKELLK